MECLVSIVKNRCARTCHNVCPPTNASTDHLSGSHRAVGSTCLCVHITTLELNFQAELHPLLFDNVTVEAI